jgi:hypothetical protein
MLFRLKSLHGFQNRLVWNKISAKLAIFCSLLFVGCTSSMKHLEDVEHHVKLSPENEKKMKSNIEKIGPCFDKLRKTIENHTALLDSNPEEAQYAVEFLKIMNGNYQSYLPEQAVLNELRSVPEFHVLVYGGNWCSDTHAGVPSLYKVLDGMGVKPENVEYVRVGRDKLPVDPSEIKIGVGPVPLVVVKDSNGLEKGRIVETPQKSWELDLLSLVK